jgi:hypothetical protein
MDSGAFESHEASQSFNFSNINILCVSSSALGWQFMGLVLAPVCRDNFDGFVI